MFARKRLTAEDSANPYAGLRLLRRVHYAVIVAFILFLAWHVLGRMQA